MKYDNVVSILEGFKKQDITALSKAITLVESKLDTHRQLATELMAQLSQKVEKSAKVIGISGTPGVGKSTFIESFGKSLTAKKLRVAVLAIDPSSQLTGGSILGDKTRMNELAIDPLSFIRPSPAGDTLGGVALKTREAIKLCEAYGFDYIIVETVGVGQSEVSVSKIVDYFILLLQPGAGDDLQAIKRGILELADLVCINKADGDLLNSANIAKNEYENALKILRSKSEVKVLLCSALKRTGLDDIYKHIETFYKTENNNIELKREKQMNEWFDQLVKENIIAYFFKNKETQSRLEIEKKKLLKKETSLSSALESIMENFK